MSDKQFSITIGVDADSLDDARALAEKWKLSKGARVTAIVGPPEMWYPDADVDIPEPADPRNPPELPPTGASAPILSPSADEPEPPEQGVDRPAESRSQARSGDESTP